MLLREISPAGFSGRLGHLTRPQTPGTNIDPLRCSINHCAHPLYIRALHCFRLDVGMAYLVSNQALLAANFTRKCHFITSSIKPDSMPDSPPADPEPGRTGCPS